VKKFHIIIAFFAITVFAQQQEMPQENSESSSVYLHPVAFAALAADMLYINLTGEFPLNGRYALIVNPSVIWLYGTSETVEGVDKTFWIGSGIGIRRFVNGNADGLYLQLMPNIGYFKSEDSDRYSAINADILGYIGYSIKYSKIRLFFDFGIGYGFTHYFSVDKEYKESIKDEPRFFGMGTRNDLSFDINIGIGIPLL